MHLAISPIAPEIITRYRSIGGDRVVRWLRYDTLGRMVLNVEPNTSIGFTPDPNADISSLKAWRYAYNAAGDLVGTSDARGCGSNYVYDPAGRLLGEDYVPCETHHAPYTQGDPMTGEGFEVWNTYDVLAAEDRTGIEAAEPECAINQDLYPGRLVTVEDRGAKTVSVFDGRGRIKCAARQMAKPGSGATQYAAQWYATVAKYDLADRPIEESTGAKVQELAPEGKSYVTTSYTARGGVKKVSSAYGDLVFGAVHDADGLLQSVQYGDLARTRTEMSYDDKRRLRNVMTYRGPPAAWTSVGQIVPTPLYNGTNTTPSTFQLVFDNLEYAYDEVDNPVEIRDWRISSEWPAGAKPVTRKISYDDLYRVRRVDYQYEAGDDTWVDPFAPESMSPANPTPVPPGSGVLEAPERAKPSPQVRFDKRVLRETFDYDWLGNTIKTDDDAHGFYDRSLGVIANGTANDGPYQLRGASNEASGGTRQGRLTAVYDGAGNLVSMAVRRNGPCVPATAVCSQRYVYEWDEVGRLVHARRWDLANPGVASDAVPSGTPAAELRYGYNAGDQRTIKTAVDAEGHELHTVYVFPSLELRRTVWNSGTQSFERNMYTETPYLFAHGVRLGRVVWEPEGAPEMVGGGANVSTSRRHVFLTLLDHLGSTTTVLDLATSEVVERGSYRAFGGTGPRQGSCRMLLHSMRFMQQSLCRGGLSPRPCRD